MQEKKIIFYININFDFFYYPKVYILPEFGSISQIATYKIHKKKHLEL